MNRFEQSPQSDPASFDEATKRESQAKSMMGEAEKTGSDERAKIMSVLNFDQKTMDDFERSFKVEEKGPNEFSKYSFEVNGHEVTFNGPEFKYLSDPNINLYTLKIDGLEIGGYEQIYRIRDRYIPLILAVQKLRGLYNKTDREISKDKEKRLVDEVVA